MNISTNMTGQQDGTLIVMMYAAKNAKKFCSFYFAKWKCTFGKALYVCICQRAMIRVGNNMIIPLQDLMFSAIRWGKYVQISASASAKMSWENWQKPFIVHP